MFGHGFAKSKAKFNSAKTVLAVCKMNSFNSTVALGSSSSYINEFLMLFMFFPCFVERV